MNQWIYDIEVYSNYFLVVFLNVETNEWSYWEKFNDIDSPWQLTIPDGTLVGFNSKNYDLPMLSAALYGATNIELKQLSDEIIVNRKMWWTHNNLIEVDHIDIIEVLPGTASLKIYAGRNGFKRLQDLPIEPSAIITEQGARDLREYCLLGDCMGTLSLFNEIQPQLDLRVKMGQQYGIDLRSKSDAQIAEAVLVSEYESMTNNRVSKPSPTSLIGRYYRYDAPAYMKFETPYLQALLQEILETDFVVGDKGAITIPKNLANKIIDVEGAKYKVANGGIHSVDKPGSFYDNDDMVLEDVDVAGYYPAIIINNKYEPSSMINGFNFIYENFHTDRMTLKRKLYELEKELSEI